MIQAIPLAVAMLGCATIPDCREVCVADTCVHYCRTQERVTRRCAKNAFKSDTGDLWREDGTYVDADGKTHFIAACTDHYPGHKYPFHVWLWELEAWRRSHEDCHIAVFKRGGSIQEHQETCHDFGLNRGKRRM